MEKPTVLTLIGAFWPGNSASGPNQSYRAMCEGLGDEFDFRFAARDRAFDAQTSAAASQDWVDLGFAKGRYLPIGRFGAEGLGSLLRETPHDILVLNGFFDRDFTLPALIRRRLGRVPRSPTLLSPRGEFAAGALTLKTPAKRAYLAFARAAGLLSDVWLHATSPAEGKDIARGFSRSRGILEAQNIRLMIDRPHDAATPAKERLRLVFLGRVSPVKNLDYALEALRHVRSDVEFAIHGPIGDTLYWQTCQAIVASLPRNIRVLGPSEAAYDEVPAILAASDMLYLPTRGENFGHAIFEALACGLPVLISDQTPWLDLEQSDAGWTLPLDDPQAFARKIDHFASLPPAARAKLNAGARRRAERWIADGDAVARTRAMLHTVLRGQP